MRGKSFKGDQRDTYFTTRVTDIWNALSEEVVYLYIITIFMRYFDRYFNRQEWKAMVPMWARGISITLLGKNDIIDVVR